MVVDNELEVARKQRAPGATAPRDSAQHATTTRKLALLGTLQGRAGLHCHTEWPTGPQHTNMR